MAATNTPLDSLKNAVLRATDSMSGATDAVCGSQCGHDHEPELEWFDSIEHGLWLNLAEHVPGITIDKHGLVEFTPEARQAVHTYDDGTPVSVHIKHPNGYYATDYYPRFDGPRWVFVERFERWAAKHLAESIAYEAAQPRPADELLDEVTLPSV